MFPAIFFKYREICNKNPNAYVKPILIFWTWAIIQEFWVTIFIAIILWSFFVLFVISAERQKTCILYDAMEYGIMVWYNVTWLFTLYVLCWCSSFFCCKNNNGIGIVN